MNRNRNLRKSLGLRNKTLTMTEDKKLFAEKVPAGKRTYFLDVLENHKGHKFIKFTESRLNEGEFIRQSVRIFEEDFDKIFDAFGKMKAYIEANHEGGSKFGSNPTGHSNTDIG